MSSSHLLMQLQLQRLYLWLLFVVFWCNLPQSAQAWKGLAGVSLSLPPIRDDLHHTNSVQKYLQQIVDTHVIADNNMLLKTTLSSAMPDLDKLALLLKENCLLSKFVEGDNSYLARTISQQFPDDPVLLDLPPSYLEQLVYGKINQCFRYEETGIDPFIETKLKLLTKAIPTIESIAQLVPELIDYDASEAVQKAILCSLAAGGDKDSSVLDTELESTEHDNKEETKRSPRKALKLVQLLNNFYVDNVVINDLPVVSNYINSLEAEFAEGKDTDISIITNSCGEELVADLLVAHTLLLNDICNTVTFHVSSYPCYKYPTALDVVGHVDYIATPTTSDVWTVRHFGDALRRYLLNDQIRITSDEFWAMPTPLWEAPESVTSALSKSKMVIMKGDHNYRRLIGNRDWGMDTSVNGNFDYFDVPLCLLRMCETDAMVGLSSSISSKMNKVDRKWMKTGKYGIIQAASFPN